MKKDLTELVFILDRSGSMMGLEADTIGGFNAMIQRQRRQKGRALVSTVLFDHVSQVLHDRVDLKDIRPMTGKQYFVRGNTALLDALGDAIGHISRVHRYAQRQDRPQHTVFVVTTDGLENASRRYGVQQVRRLVRRQKEQYGWEFLFLGANMDAIQTAGRLGISPDRAANYCPDAPGVRLNYAVVGEALCAIRQNCPLGESWKAPIDRDWRRRG